MLTGLALLREQQRLAALQQQPEALLLLSPAVNMSDTSAFARGEPVSSHIDVEDGDAAAATGGEKAVANTTQQQQQQNSNSSSGDLLQFASFSELKQQIQQHHHQQQHLSKQQQRQHQVGGPAGTLQLLLGLAGELKAVWSAHRSKAGAAAAAAAGWFDYLPGSAVADNIHHYLHVRMLVLRLFVICYFVTVITYFELHVTAGGRCSEQRPHVQVVEQVLARNAASCPTTCTGGC